MECGLGIWGGSLKYSYFNRCIILHKLVTTASPFANWLTDWLTLLMSHSFHSNFRYRISLSTFGRVCPATCSLSWAAKQQLTWWLSATSSSTGYIQLTWGYAFMNVLIRSAFWVLHAKKDILHTMCQERSNICPSYYVQSTNILGSHQPSLC